MEVEGKLISMKEAVKRYVRDGDMIYLGCQGENDVFAAAHEIIRQKKRDLTITKAVGGILFDQLIGSGCAERVITSHVWNELGPRPAYALRRAVEKGIPRRIMMEDESNYSMMMRYLAGSLNLPFVPMQSLLAVDLIKYSPPERKTRSQVIQCPFTGKKVCVVSALKPDVGFIHAQRVDREGNAHLWGMLGETKYGINACKKIIISAEKVVDAEEIKRNPYKTIISGLRVDAVIEEPWGAHPSPVEDFYDRDIKYFVVYGDATKTQEGFEAFLDEWIYAMNDRGEYLRKLGEERLNELRFAP